MVFYYSGKKTSKGFDITQSILLVVALVAIIFMFTSIDSFDDYEKHFFELLLTLIAGGSIFYNFFRKKAKPHTYKIEFINDYLYVDSLKIPTENIQIYVYKKSDKFYRYHLFDENGILSIYSVFKDDLLDYVTKNHPEKSIESTEISSSIDGNLVKVITDFGQLNYNLETGKYFIEKEGETIKNITPELYVYDPKYKKGIPFNKK